MSETTAGPRGDDDLEELPGFQPLTAAPDDDPLPEGVTHLSDPTPPEPPPPNHRPPPAGAGTGPTTAPGPSTSSRTSTDEPSPPSGGPFDAELEERIDEALAGLAGGLFQLAGIGVNRATQRKRPGSRLWIPTEAETQTFGDALGRIAGRRVPEEMVTDDAGDLLVAGSTLLGYGMHNALGITGDELEARMAGEPAYTPPQPAPPAPTTAPPPRAAAVVVQPQPQAAPAASEAVPPPDDPTTAPPPPAVIDPGI
jgi:hypothetical protein